jgi:peptidoglycan/xylan/chitin deacetylase (PgdA/CDA1 family)
MNPVPERCRSWTPTPAIRASAAFHLSGVAALAFDPLSWAYVAAALAGNHALLGLAGMCPRSAVLGPNLRRLPPEAIARRQIALTFDDGPHPDVTGRVLETLDRYGAKASFFCVGTTAAARPDIVREIVRRGHSVENHSHHHPGVFAAYGMNRLRREIEAAQHTLASITGAPPCFFRAPAGLRSPLLDPVLARLGLGYVSWTRRAFDTVDRNPATVLRRLTRNLAAGDVLALHDRTHGRRDRRPPVVLAVLPALLERIRAENLSAVSLRTACNA